MNSMSLKQKLKNNKLTLGSWITISNPLIPEILSPAGFDWLCVDLEHTSIELNELLPIIISIENQKMTPLVRVGENNLKAIISGNNSTKIDLLYLKENMSFEDGELVYTSGDGGHFNPGIPIGVIKKENNTIYVEPLNNLSEVQYINIFINQFKDF